MAGTAAATAANGEALASATPSSEQPTKAAAVHLDNDTTTKSDDDSSSPSPSTASSTSDEMNSTDASSSAEASVSAPSATSATSATSTSAPSASSKGKSLQDRARIPSSLYLTVGTIAMMQYSSGMWSMSTVTSWCSSITSSIHTLHGFVRYFHDLGSSAARGNYRSWTEYAAVFATTLCVFFPLYVFVIAPFRAGLWTGQKARKHKIHRYMGLLFMTLYALAWVEFLTDYDDEDGHADVSFLPHSVALNGIVQSTSAYLSFKVLPELDDAGYYSDKAVMSRNFVHENIFFSLMTVFGSVYYNSGCRTVMRTNWIGQTLELAFVFWPYIVIRPFFPITRFKNAGTTRKGRTAQNQRFYEISTTLVKIFFLWAKYFLGFFMNFMVYLNLVDDDKWKLLHGLFILNVGTVSLAMFLHTLRFKKVLPPRFTFTLYLVQIYATFSAIPCAWDMFAAHPKLCALAAAGLLCNMTRNRKVHGVWCLSAMILLNAPTGIEW